LAAALFSWSSKKQELVTFSTAEAEYVAAKEALRLRRLIRAVFRLLTNLITLYSDSQAVTTLIQDGSFHLGVNQSKLDLSQLSLPAPALKSMDHNE
jgi:ribonuclease HI